MKFSIGINGYKEYKDLESREKLCLDSLIKIKKQIQNINLYNICFTDENITYKDFKTLNTLALKSNEVIKNFFQNNEQLYLARQNEIDSNTKQLPIVKEIFDTLANTDCDYFVFLNNDIILSDRLFKEVLTSKKEAYTVSRVNINDIKDLNTVPDILEYCVHGFDAFVIRKDVWFNIRNNIENFILGRFYWDTFTATFLNLMCECKNLNKLPPVCFHVEHPNVSAKDTIENYYCETIFKQHNVINNMWFNYVYNVLFKREAKKDCKWFYPLTNEDTIEEKYFNQISNISIPYQKKYTPCTIENSTDYDIFIPVAPKDEIKLQYVIEGAIQNSSAKNIYICSPHDIKNKIHTDIVSYINDKDVLNIPDKSFISFRPNWTYQQFLKLFFKAGQSNYFFALDSDTILLKKIELFEDGHPIWYYGAPQNHIPYFIFNKKAFNVYKTLPHTGIGDSGLFNKQIINDILHYTGVTSPEELLHLVGNALNPFFHFSEYEFYSNFVNTYFPNLYHFKQYQQSTHGRNLDAGENWSVQDIEKIIKQAKIKDQSILTLHSWKI